MRYRRLIGWRRPASQKNLLPLKHEPGPTRPRLHNESPCGHMTTVFERPCIWATSSWAAMALTPWGAARDTPATIRIRKTVNGIHSSVATNPKMARQHRYRAQLKIDPRPAGRRSYFHRKRAYVPMARKPHCSTLSDVDPCAAVPIAPARVLTPAIVIIVFPPPVI